MPEHGDKADPHDIPGLYKSIKYSTDALKPFREARLAALKQYVGKHYGGDNHVKRAVPLNLLELAVQTYKHLLAAQAPRELITTPFDELKPSAANLELALEHLVREIKLKQTLQDAVVAALFGVGIVKIGLEHGGHIEIDGETHELGQPYADVVHLDDWVHDTTARKWGECSFMGNRYRLFIEHAKNEPTFDKELREKLTVTEYDQATRSGDQKAESLSESGGRLDGGYRDYVELWDIYLPFDNVVLTLPFEDSGDIQEPLRIAEYDGPEGGPYRRLAFSEVEDNVMPLPETAVMMDMHLLANSVLRKLDDQARRQKSMTAFQKGDEDDADTLKKGRDGDMLGMNGTLDELREIKTGGIEPQMLAFLLQVRDLFSYQAGNLDALAGLAAQSETVGQDRLISRAAGGRIEAMQIVTTEFAHEIMKTLAWYLWEDPFIDLPLTKRVPGTPIEVPTSFNEESREGDFLDYNFKMEPHSMQFLSPQARLAVVYQTLEKLAPFLPMMEAQGIVIDIAELLNTTSDLTGVEQVKDIFIFSGGEKGPARPMMGKPPAKAATTHRVYERRNRTDANPNGTSGQMIQALQQMAGSQQAAAPAGQG